jgi:hypothetical protein
MWFKLIMEQETFSTMVPAHMKHTKTLLIQVISYAGGKYRFTALQRVGEYLAHKHPSSQFNIAFDAPYTILIHRDKGLNTVC